MVTTYTITVNGKSYDVDVKKKASSKTAAPVKPAAAPVAATEPAVKAVHKPAEVNSGNMQIKAPMPGKVVTLKISVGDKIEKGQEVIVVEAMKMLNPILAPGSGVVKEILIGAGDPIQTGQVLIMIETLQA